MWHLQIVHHDVWGYDLPAAPILGDITVDGRRIKAVVRLTKHGFAISTCRHSGSPGEPVGS